MKTVASRSNSAAPRRAPAQPRPIAVSFSPFSANLIRNNSRTIAAIDKTEIPESFAQREDSFALEIEERIVPFYPSSISRDNDTRRLLFIGYAPPTPILGESGQVSFPYPVPRDTNLRDPGRGNFEGEGGEEDP